MDVHEENTVERISDMCRGMELKETVRELKLDREIVGVRSSTG